MKFLRFILVIFLVVLVESAVRAQNESEPEILTYTSRLDGTIQKAYYAISGNGDEPRPLIIHLCPPSPGNDKEAFAYAKRALHAAGENAVYLRPFGRGGTVFQDAGEIDFFEALAAIEEKVKIDPTRISLFGTSMGGAGALYLASHYPDRFSAVATVAGYSDYQLWNKPGYIFQRYPWEEFSWRSRSAVYQVENLRESGLWLLHGEWDRNSTAGGVSVDQSLGLAEQLKKEGIPYQVSILPRVGHEITWMLNPFSPARRFDEKVISWLVTKRLEPVSRNVEIKTFSLRHNRSSWVRINQFIDYGNPDHPAHVRASLEPQEVLSVATENVAHLTLGPIPGEETVSLLIDGKHLGTVDMHQEVHLEKKPWKKWKIVSAMPAMGEKQFENAGPIGDVFFEPTLFVTGTKGNPEENYFNRSVATDVSRFVNFNNGGVNRGEMLGSQNLELVQKKDTEVSEEEKRDFNLALFGTTKTNKVLAEFVDKLPLKFGKDEITLGEKTYKGSDVAIVAIFPNPENKKRYLLIHGGVSPDAITWGSNFNLALLPDFIVYNRNKVLDWGFFNNLWRR